ncbi:hypothetical protein WDJ51_06930 [Rathayibacter sp. YIM 133350]|uniref:hypothetical protein n=1 Tax=Rathayibacter sp. YIM 133350 TaxID=3131992 RepID=UPI00307FA270
MSDVLISFSVLNQLNGSLKQILVELEEAEEREGDLQDAIGRPCGRDKLRDRAHDFEGSWDDKRSKLKEDLGKVQQHVEQAGQGWQDWDTKAANSLKVDADAASKLPKKN